MIKVILPIIFLTLSGLAQANSGLFSEKVSPKDAWDFLESSKYLRLPHYKVTYGSFFSALGENLLNFDSKRSVTEKNHFIPFQRKLIFPNGICVRGKWKINEHNHGYSGYFKSSSKGVIIGRVATATGNIHYRKHRTIGLSGKIFPTDNVEDTTVMSAANFQTMNAGGGGINKEYVSEAFLTNAAPSTAPLRGLPLLRVGLAVSEAFNLADKRRDIRQLYQIAELDEEDKVVSPKWMWLKANQETIEMSHELKKDDFRDETSALIDEMGVLSFDIMVADSTKRGQPSYHKIGVIEFDKYVASASCDQSLHFQHPPYLEEFAAPEVEQDSTKIRREF